METLKSTKNMTLGAYLSNSYINEILLRVQCSHNFEAKCALLPFLPMEEKKEEGQGKPQKEYVDHTYFTS